MCRCTVAIICVVFGMLWSGSTCYGAEQPNVVMISIDDLNDWTGFLGGHPDVSTPNMDELAKRGRNFSNAHCAVYPFVLHHASVSCRVLLRLRMVVMRLAQDMTNCQR